MTPTVNEVKFAPVPNIDGDGAFSDYIFVSGKITFVGFDIPDDVEYGIQLVYSKSSTVSNDCCASFADDDEVYILPDLSCPRECMQASMTPYVISKNKPTLVINEYKGYTIRIVRLGGNINGLITYTIEESTACKCGRSV